jgi:hypothetical protein
VLIRHVRIGGATKAELLSDLHAAQVHLNDSALALFENELFTTTSTASIVETVELSAASLGLPSGGTFAQVLDHAARRGLSTCPLELGPHLRLQFVDQPEGFLGHPLSQDRAPPGSVTIASLPPSEDDQVPKGFYLRRIAGVLWLRGYRSWPGHVWSPEDAFVFATARAHIPELSDGTISMV